MRMCVCVLFYLISLFLHILGSDCLIVPVHKTMLGIDESTWGKPACYDLSEEFDSNDAHKCSFQPDEFVCMKQIEQLGILESTWGHPQGSEDSDDCATTTAGVVDLDFKSNVDKGDQL